MANFQDEEKVVCSCRECEELFFEMKEGAIVAFSYARMLLKKTRQIKEKEIRIFYPNTGYNNPRLRPLGNCTRIGFEEIREKIAKLEEELFDWQETPQNLLKARKVIPRALQLIRGLEDALDIKDSREDIDSEKLPQVCRTNPLVSYLNWPLPADIALFSCCQDIPGTLECVRKARDEGWILLLTPDAINRIIKAL